MITLYVKTGCPYCAKVKEALHELQLPYDEKNIKDPEVVQELLETGGKRQVPFMDDDNMTPYLIDDDVEMYESDCIVVYLNEKYGNTAREVKEEQVTVHESEREICDTNLSPGKGESSYNEK